MRVGILGANGFIGSRITEMFYLTRFADVRPIIRSLSGLAVLSRYNLEFRIADALDQNALKNAFTGCDAVVNCISGDPGTILNSIKPVYHAAKEAGIQRLVYLSSSSVHGQMPAEGTDETSILEYRQPLAYNNAKVRAEKLLLKLRKKSKVEVVILRPGIVYGPRSSWITNFANDLLQGRAWLLDKGNGICNSIYIDNLVHAVGQALTEEDIDEEAFIVRDREVITWADLYKPIAEYLGFNLDEIHEPQEPFRIQNNESIIDSINNNRRIKTILSPIPKKIRLAVYNTLSAILDDKKIISPWDIPQPSEPIITLEKLMLYKCRYALPWKKAYKFLNYEPIVSFEEACSRTLSWMEFAGYRKKFIIAGKEKLVT